ncbi:MAG TPA: HAD family hydrolase [Leptolyngbyaceae cyanobacterium]
MPEFQALSSLSFAKSQWAKTGPKPSHPCLVASDLDGTLTQQGELTSLLIQALQELRSAGIPVVIVTGRSAGWVSGLVQYLPVAGAIAENGGLFFPKADANPMLLVEISDLSAHRQRLADLFAQLQAQHPQLQESTDNRYRLTDWTFDVEGLSPEELEALAAACEQAGWGFTYSNVQCHLKLAQQNKAKALLQVLETQFPKITPQEIITVGDSPNDDSLFDPDLFPHSIGMANIQPYWEVLSHHPAYVTQGAESQGFLELSRALIEARSRRLRED